MPKELTAERLRELLDYDATNGVFRWRAYRCGVEAGSVAGKTPHHRGYIYISVDGRKYSAHRLAYLYVTGEWPPHEVDHIDGDRANNRWLNLRSATAAEQARNSRPKNGKYQKGVCKVGNRFMARIGLGYKNHYLGSFASEEEAHAAYCNASLAMHGEFGRTK